MHKEIKWNPNKPTKKWIETHWKTHSLCGFRLSRKREIERLKRKIRIERDKPEINVRKREKKKLVALQGIERNASEIEERACERFQKFHRIWNLWIWPIKFWLDLGLNLDPFLLTYSNKEFEFEAPQIHSQIHGIQT